MRENRSTTEAPTPHPTQTHPAGTATRRSETAADRTTGVETDYAYVPPPPEPTQTRRKARTTGHTGMTVTQLRAAIKGLGETPRQLGKGAGKADLEQQYDTITTKKPPTPKETDDEASADTTRENAPDTHREKDGNPEAEDSPLQTHHQGTKDQVKDDPDEADNDDNDTENEEAIQDEFEVEKLVGSRQDKAGRNEFLVHWRGYDQSDASWEPEHELRITAAEAIVVR